MYFKINIHLYMHYAARYAYFYLDFCIDIFSLD